MKTEAIEKNSDQSQSKKIITYGILLLLVFVSAIMVVFQVFEYRQDYRQLSTYMRERDDLNAEWGRLLIEQQTFGATAQIGTRAVTQLRMYSPPIAQTVVISLPQTPEQKK
ncbi:MULTISPECIES: cell division protein FtsL [Acinetobacter]|jgi:cell division protein FtsL|uniref:Cell division protein FtsL n=1 Tax=Acinetobacter amyesii TaxID=2942470 RepID=A0A1T1H4U9_9GAMM|nr:MULTISPECIES: cell division protein FtsL [Acinetobacter]MCL6232238.1 cell division protein FtsL [Acinetobacter amyesii]MCL6239682.1 cell division protein FtsL [Acinetobacter amyesii]MCL6240314.1 cell division protein FtsL [Acinetobacter amyesii]MCL6244158.1 cell division protein FtsL [Acinetobacter amyesii]MCL6247001.1 cell division protein FtsL [Acinetobacter amyesii]